MTISAREYEGRLTLFGSDDSARTYLLDRVVVGKACRSSLPHDLLRLEYDRADRMAWQEPGVRPRRRYVGAVLVAVARLVKLPGSLHRVMLGFTFRRRIR